MTRNELKVIAWTAWVIAAVCALVAFSRIYNPHYPKWINFEEGRGRRLATTETGFKYSPDMNTLCIGSSCVVPENGVGWIIGMITCVGAGILANVAAKRVSENEK